MFLKTLQRRWNWKTSKLNQLSLPTLLTGIPQNAPKNIFDLPDLLTIPKHFTERSFDAIHRIDFIRSYLRDEKSSLSYKEQLRLLDAISVEICNIIDAADLCRNVHNASDFQQSAEEAFAILSQLIIDLNTDVHLYDLVENILRTSKVVQSSSQSRQVERKESQNDKEISTEEFFFAMDMYNEFRSEGIHLLKQKLPETDRTTTNKQERMKQIQQDVVQTETLFSQNIRQWTFDEKDVVTVGPYLLSDESQREEYHRFSHWLDNVLKQYSGGKYNHKTSLEIQGSGYLYCPPTRNILTNLLANSQEEPLRQSMWLELLLQPWNNLETFSQLLQKRQALANSLSFSSYSEKALRKSIYNRPEEVNAMLKHLSMCLQERTRVGLDQLAAVKRALSPSSSLSSASTVQPWDLSYLQNMHRFMMPESDDENQNSEIQEQVQAYFELSDCLDSLRMISREVYSIDMIEEEIEASELWVLSKPSESLFGSKSSSSFPGIKKYIIMDLQEQKKIGTVYFDCFTREHKFNGSAHFTVRCGCDRYGWKFSPPPKEDPKFATFLQRPLQDLFTLEQQLPIVVLAFPWHHQQRNRKLLSLSELEGLYHEWGHALHSLFSKSSFQHLSGTRGSTDYIEIPSHFMEYFARDPRVIRKWAKHHQTRQPIPEALLLKAFKQRNHLIGIDLQTQILFSAVDQHLFSNASLQWNEYSAETVFLKALEESAKIQAEYTILPLGRRESFTSDATKYLEMTSCRPATQEIKKTILKQLPALPHIHLLNHNHFITYGGSYYSYLLARLYAAQIWFQLFADDPFSKEAGKILREQMLAFGGAKPPREILDQIVGKELDPSYFIRDITQ